MASGGMAAKLRKRHGRKVEIDGETFFVRSPTMKELREVDQLRDSQKNGTPEQQQEAARFATAAWFGFVICEDAEGSLAFPRSEGEDAITWAKRIEDELSDIENTTLQAISAKVNKLTTQPSVESIVKN